jgi:hypothetical protein
MKHPEQVHQSMKMSLAVGKNNQHTPAASLFI